MRNGGTAFKGDCRIAYGASFLGSDRSAVRDMVYRIIGQRTGCRQGARHIPVSRQKKAGGALYRKNSLPRRAEIGHRDGKHLTEPSLSRIPHRVSAGKPGAAGLHDVFRDPQRLPDVKAVCRGEGKAQPLL